MSEEIESQELSSKSDLEFTGQQNLAGKRIDHLLLVMDKLRNHIVNLEAINQLLENKANSTKDQDEKIRTLKSMSYNYDRLIKLYEVYQTYEMAIQRYHVHVTDTINKKYQVTLNVLKNKQEPVSMDFFRRMNDLLKNSNSMEISEKTKIDDPDFNL
jgi:hypothetical protein